MTDFSTYREVLRTMPPEPYRTPADIDCRTTPNVGDLMAVAMAAAGTFALVTGGRTACETDYLAASGATFPDVPYDRLVTFNRETLKPCMSEEDEWRRYAAHRRRRNQAQYARPWKSAQKSRRLRYRRTRRHGAETCATNDGGGGK